MSEDRSEHPRDLRDALVETLRRARRQAPPGGLPHPTPDVLVAYHSGELPDPERERLREHLAFCPECADFILDYRDFAAAEPGGAASAAAAAWERHREPAWEAVRRGIGGAPEATPPEPVLAPDRAGGSPGERWLAAALAAACLVLGVSLWRARSELGSPSPAAVVALQPEGSGVLRGPGRPGAPEVRPAERGRVVVILAHPDLGDFPRYEVRLESRGAIVARRLELAPGPDGTLALELGARPGPGDYRIVLYGVAAGGGRRELATYLWRIAEPGPSEGAAGR
ncbi:MAG TPA: zf-HC2 domain-containing protein, partial [Thermoanaerobaculia bacterium]|nr:zf-HC2 domain-containing protein [Thermoanaerobaculia bacterium]